MGFFRWFRKTSEFREITLDKVPDFIRRERSADIDSEAKKLRDAAQRLDSEFAKLGTFVAALQKKQPMSERVVGQREAGETLAEHYDIYSVGVKNKFCARAGEIIGALRCDDNGYEGYKNYIKSAGEAVAAIGGIGVKEFRHLNAFRDDLKPIAAQIKLLESLVADNRKMIDGITVMRKVHEIGQHISEIRKLAAENDKLVGEKEELAVALSELRKAGEEQRVGVEEIQKDASAVDKLAAEKALLERERADAKAAISTGLSGLDRIFRKFSHTDTGKRMHVKIKPYVANPADAYIDDDASLAPLLETVDDDGKAFLGADELERAQIIRANLQDIDRYKDEYLVKSSELERVGKLIEDHSETFRRLSAAEDALRTVQQKIADTVKNVEKKEARIAEISAQMAGLRDDVERELRSLGIVVTIKTNENM